MVDIPSIPTVGELNQRAIDNLVTPVLGDFSKTRLDINTYRSKFLGANARSYLFVCRVQFPGVQNAIKSGLGAALANPSTIGEMVGRGLVAGGVSAINVGGTDNNTEDFKYFVKSTTLPESNVEETSTFYMGHQYKLSSTRRTNDWTVTFVVDDNAYVLKKFWDWHLLLHNPESGMYGSAKDYMTDQTIQLLGIDGSPICTYNLFGAWPKSIGQVSLDYATNDFANVDVTFTYQYHTVTNKVEPGILKTGRTVLRAIGEDIVKFL